jgi:flavin-dependent dehydrogenase
MPDSLPALRGLGVRLDIEESFAFRGIRFIGAGTRVRGDFPGGVGIAMRRTRLHQILIDRAAELGVRMLWGTRVTGFSSQSVEVAGRSVRCRWLIGADGQNSRVRRWAGLDRARYEAVRFGFRRHYLVSPWTDYMEIHWGRRSQIYVSPVSQSEVCVALIARDSRLRLDEALQQFPELSARLAGAPATTSERGAITASRRLRRVYRGGTILVGDASGSVDAITGEGMSLSFHQALALADALAAGNLETYQAAHRRLARRPHWMARLMLLLDRSEWIRCRVMRGLASEPAIFDNLLAMHVGAIAPADFVLHGMLPLGRQILIAS